ncbi:SDR family oxidoreductase [Zavarzinia sp. CC-PAN008]|uniref:SDR family oxidoreductase n=1 Tax=Zavarzinia sp. CC-PAN008 TaxID=3243332 RepID=UPI003F744552
MTKTIAFITGANRGLGLETARGLARKGIHVVLGARTQSAADAAAATLKGEGLDVSALKLDVTDTADHKAAHDWFQATHGVLDILVNNAGVFLDPRQPSGQAVPASQTPEDALRGTFDVNFFAPILLTQALLPLIAKSKAGRIVNLSSILGSHTLHADPKAPIYHAKALAYDASKSALNAFTTHLAYELRDTPIKVNSVHPGWVKTDMGGEGADLDIVDGAKTSIAAATLPDDGPTGAYFHMDQMLPW